MRHLNSYLFNPGLNTCMTCFITGSETKNILSVSTALCKIRLEHQINKFSALLGGNDISKKIQFKVI